MATAYNKKTPQELIYEDNKAHIRFRVNEVLDQMKRRLMDDAMDKMSQDFNEGLAIGEIRALGQTYEHTVQIVRRAADSIALESRNA